MKKLFLVLPILLTGCASALTVGETDFVCGDGVECPTPIEVYNKTHTTPSELRVGKTPKSWQADSDKKVVQIPDAQEAQKQALLMPSRIGVDQDRIVVPLREGSRVVRIWIAPWVDKSDKLHWARYIFAEITTRKWQFGERDVRSEQTVPFVEAAPDVEPGLAVPAR